MNRTHLHNVKSRTWTIKKQYTLQCTWHGVLQNLVYRVDTFSRTLDLSPGSIREKQSMQTSLHTLNLLFLLQNAHKQYNSKNTYTTVSKPQLVSRLGYVAA